MKRIIFAIICVLAIATLPSCSKQENLYKGRVVKVSPEFKFVDEKSYFEVRVEVSLGDSVVVNVPVTTESIRARVLAADKLGILDSFEAQLYSDDGKKFTNLEYFFKK